MSAEDRYHVKRYLSRTDRKALSAKYQCTCRHDWGKGMQPAVHYLRVLPNGKLDHTTLCEHPSHLKGVREQYHREHINGSGLMTERKKNLKLWQKLKAAYDAKVRAYAKLHGITFEQAQLELNRYAMMDQEDQEFLQQEGLR